MTTPQSPTEIIAIAQSYTDEPVHLPEDAQTVLQVILDLGGSATIERLCEVMHCDWDTMHELVIDHLYDQGCVEAHGCFGPVSDTYRVVS